ncbi:hypothetical protein V6N11_009229 [Hibiscus sabdariffa]|uniref:RNase H type-1 domain-containing protein n=1 Tax=Hibiscus sabdariffa TaxID=183260 RepID=A0ABR2PQ02_9ROSI
MWTSWTHRNHVIFKGLKLDVSSLFDACIQRLSWWCTAKWPEAGISINDVINCPVNFMQFGNSLEQIIKSTWCPPALGELKFNTDGAVRGAFGEGGIGGCLRNEKEQCLIMFSKSAGRVDPMSAEILAIKEAVKLFKKSYWSRNYKLIIETDSELAVQWMKYPHQCPTPFKALIADCLDSCKGVNWHISFANRDCNVLADNLAKKRDK